MEEKEKELIADLHVHSCYSRATSRNLNVANLVKYARIKGVDLLGTGDFTHPEWLNELKGCLKEREGLCWYKDGKEEFPFILSSEISLAFTQGGKARKVHLVYLAPSFEVVDRINKHLDARGRRDYDGRPIFGMSCSEFVREMKNISEDIEIIPAHAWTPWFGILGSKSGFDSLREAFGDEEKHIYAIETGLSSDPEMNWRVNELCGKSIVSFSDLHSFWPWRIGREATVFTGKLSYSSIINQIRCNKFKATIEVEPAYGKYHWDGHRACNFSCPPEKTKELNGVCPVCKKPLTIGVESRVEELAGNPKGYMPQQAKPFYKLLPLHELISFAIGSSMNSKRTWEIYNELIAKFGNEFNILLGVDKNILMRELSNKETLLKLIIDNRIANLCVQPGYDGEYGKLILKDEQKKLF